MSKICILMIKFYRKYLHDIFFRGSNCIYEPTCSVYAIQAFEKYGFLKGMYLSVKRVLRCNSFHEGGYDPLI